METLKNIGWAMLGWIINLYISVALIIILIGLPLAIILGIAIYPFMLLWGLLVGGDTDEIKTDKEE